MKKRILLSIAVIVVLFVSLGFFVYNEIIRNVFRYTTPEDSFTNSCPRGASLIDILECHNIAMIVYETKDGVASCSIISKEKRGWTPLSLSYIDQKNILVENGFVNKKEISGKFVIDIELVIEQDIPSISDNLNSEIETGSSKLASGKKLVYGLLVSEVDFPDNYELIIGDQKVTFN